MNRPVDVLAVMRHTTTALHGLADEAELAQCVELRDRAHALSDARAAVAELVEAHRRLLALAERLDLTEGVCCCGDSMDRHPEPMSCGHLPVDAGHYHHAATIKDSRAALARSGGAA